MIINTKLIKLISLVALMAILISPVLADGFPTWKSYTPQLIWGGNTQPIKVDTLSARYVQYGSAVIVQVFVDGDFGWGATSLKISPPVPVKTCIRCHYMLSGMQRVGVIGDNQVTVDPFAHADGYATGYITFFNFQKIPVGKPYWIYISGMYETNV